MSVNVTWNCEKCKANGTFKTEKENVHEYWAYYAVLMEAHNKTKKHKNCRFAPEKVHVSEVKEID
jgi:hypothetical protein